MKPLKLFWYRREANFGDALSPLVVAHVAGRRVEWAPREEAELFAVGSLMTMIANTPRETPAPRPVIWGSGCMGPVRDLAFLRDVDVALLRGPVTSALLERRDTTFGDPGLLVTDVFGTLPDRQEKIGIVPHLTKREDPALEAVVAADPRLTLIDPATRDASAVVHRIAECAYVLSSSLHGLVVADACGVPNTWLEPWGNHGFAALKFQDYAASVGRTLGAPVKVTAIQAHLGGRLPELVSYSAGIAEAQHVLRASFPQELRAPRAAA